MGGASCRPLLKLLSKATATITGFMRVFLREFLGRVSMCTYLGFGWGEELVGRVGEGRGAYCEAGWNSIRTSVAGCRAMCLITIAR